VAGDQVPLKDVLQVLKLAPTAANVRIAISGNTVTLVKDGVPEVIDLIDPVPRKMLRRFAYKYGIPIEYFFHIEMVIRGSKKRQ